MKVKNVLTLQVGDIVINYRFRTPESCDEMITHIQKIKENLLSAPGPGQAELKFDAEKGELHA